MPASILIADDYDDNRELLRVILLTAQYEVIEAHDGLECLNLAQEHLPDLIMVDLAMPKLDGAEVIRALRADERTSEIPCVLVSGYTEIDPSRNVEAAFDAYLTKPFRTGEVFETVEKLLSGRRSKMSIVETGTASG